MAGFPVVRKSGVLKGRTLVEGSGSGRVASAHSGGCSDTDLRVGGEKSSRFPKKEILPREERSDVDDG